jgi:hypothetical protein
MIRKKTGDTPEHILAATTKPTRDMATALALAAEQAMGFQLIGQFVSEFSQLDFTIRVILSRRLQLPDDYFDIVTAPYDFVTLCNVTQALLCKQLPRKKETITKLFKDCRKLNDDRVHLAHGIWTSGQDGPVVRHVSKSSLHPNYYFEEKGKLKQLAAEAQRLMNAVLTIGK